MAQQKQLESNVVFYRTLAASQGNELSQSIFGEVGASVIMSNAQIFMRGLCESWRTGTWQPYSLSNGGYFMSPNPDSPPEGFLLRHSANDFAEVVTPHLTGVIVYLYAYSQLSVHRTFGSKVWAQQHELLQEYVRGLPERNRSLIFRAVT